MGAEKLCRFSFAIISTATRSSEHTAKKNQIKMKRSDRAAVIKFVCENGEVFDVRRSTCVFVSSQMNFQVANTDTMNLSSHNS